MSIILLIILVVVIRIASPVKASTLMMPVYGSNNDEASNALLELNPIEGATANARRRKRRVKKPTKRPTIRKTAGKWNA